MCLESFKYDAIYANILWKEEDSSKNCENTTNNKILILTFLLIDNEFAKINKIK